MADKSQREKPAAQDAQIVQVLSRITHLIIDMDGVLYRGNKPIPGLQDFFAFLRQKPIGFILATNNSSRTAQEYVEKLRRMGVDVSPQEVLTSGQTVARVLAAKYPVGTRVHVFGMPSLREAVEAEGFVVADDDVEIVVASLDTEVTYDKLKHTSGLIRNGAIFYATNLDPTAPGEHGVVPGTGALIVALEAASGVKPTATGKPEVPMFEQAMVAMNATPGTTAMLGDRLDTDILGGRRAGLTTICVLSGIASRAEAEAFGPDLIFEDITALLRAWRSQETESC